MGNISESLQRRLLMSVASGFRERLLDKGLARGLIWQDGKLPPDAPLFPASLTEDLLDYAYAVMAMAIQQRTIDTISPNLDRAFLVAGEAIEAVVHRGDAGPERGFHRVNAAIAFHLAHYSARAYSILPLGAVAENLAPTEKALVHLLRRNLDEMHITFSSWLLDIDNEDEWIAERLKVDEDFDEVDATHTILTTSYMRGMALFDHAITSGMFESAAAARTQLRLTAEAARDLNAVSHWWSAIMTSHLLDELWKCSLYEQIPSLLDGDDNKRWIKLRRNYIQRLRTCKRAAIELWPSQLEAAKRSVNLTDDLVIALPTIAGKTRIAELCILRALAANQRIVYVTPLRALSAQIERDLAETFFPLGFSVSSLYGSAGIEIGDEETLRDGNIVISTPEKLDFALRNDASIIDNVGLIVLDEGHMFGPNEREVRYEALVQRLLRRQDACERRIICLSALFPTPEEMSDLVAWIRQDEPGEPIHSVWRPTRQRFGVIRWISDAARLDVKVEEESPFISRFIEAVTPPKQSRRRREFPGDKNELTLAVAWRFVEQEKDVLIYCVLRKSVETLGKLVLKCISQGVLQPLRSINERVLNAMKTGAEWLGEDHPAVKCLQYGVALHHGGLPRPFLTEVEQLLRSGDCPLTIASPTLAQGLNLSASVLLVPSIWRNKEIIPVTEFANVIGRAGRAFVDVEGLILHIVWEESRRKTFLTINQWESLVNRAKAPQVISGILQLAINIYVRIAGVLDVPIEELVDYVTGNSEAWVFSETDLAEFDITVAEWERDIASIDSAILALLDLETSDDQLESSLDKVLEGSLFSRQLERHEEVAQKFIRGFVAARAGHIWSQTQVLQRRGYHVAGIGLTAGQFLDANLERLITLLKQAEDAVMLDNAETAATAVVGFAQLVFQIAPFRTPKEMPAKWEDALRMWMLGLPCCEIINLCDDFEADFLHDAITYRLCWAMEAVRVHATTVGYKEASDLTGLAALAVEVGSSIRSAIILLRSGLSSREAAIAAVVSTGAKFIDRAGMFAWITSDDIITKMEDENWPTTQSRHAWLHFLKSEIRSDRRKWRRKRQKILVEWLAKAPLAGEQVVLEPNIGKSYGLVLSPNFLSLGEIKTPLIFPRRYITKSWVSEELGMVEVEYYGPVA